MKVTVKSKLRDILFYNNICLIVCIFSIVCLFTSLSFQNSKYSENYLYNLQEDFIVGPIKVADKSQIYKISAHFNGSNTSSYLSGEVLDEDKDTLYEFGKDLWHESGYDSEGYWSESDRDMVAYLTFSEKGTYYIQFNTEEKNLNNVTIKIELKKGSYIAHLQVGVIFLLFIIFIGYFLNRKWINEKLDIVNDVLEDMYDD